MIRSQPDLSLTDSQREILQKLPDAVAPTRVERIWIFPARTVKLRESGFLVLSLLPREGERGDGPRTVLTLRYRAEAVKGKMVLQEELAEEGSAPPDRIDRVISGVIARAGEEDAEPHMERLEGSEDRWHDLLGRAGITLDRACKE